MKRTQKEYSVIKMFVSLAKAGMLSFAFACAGIFVYAQTATVTENYVAYNGSADAYCRLTPEQASATGMNKSYVTSSIAPVNSTDPWVNSALIEFGQQKQNSSGTKQTTYPNDCLALCANVTCSNPARLVEGSDGSSSSASKIYPVKSGDFPIQSVLFEIFKYQQNANPYNPDSTPPIRTIALYPNSLNGENICPGVPVTEEDDPTKAKSCCDICWTSSGAAQNRTAGQSCSSTSHCYSVVTNFGDKLKCDAGLKERQFCAAWDGMYEIDGEFGESNGDFGFRTTISSNWPGDGISTPEIDLSHTIVYPGKDQIPIQVDVTNIHSVRSTPTVVGAKTSVTAQPYHINYRISKDATVTVNIFDASDVIANSTPASSKAVRKLVDKLPREGEGFQGGGVGSKEDTITTMTELWDGRDDEGRLLPFGNYVISLQAFSSDEWNTSTIPTDISRTVTRQLSLDPLKITDIEVTGLNKTSTGYAMINYMLTEMATVHFEVYTPGTKFTDLNVTKLGAGGTCSNGYCSNEATNLQFSNGYKVFEQVEQKGGRVKLNNKWDGMCYGTAANCANAVATVNSGTYTTTADSSNIKDYAGIAMPDGDYIYLLWAEIPYDGDTVTINTYNWVGVKTAQIKNGILGVNRGLPDLTIGKVGYSTIGSSPVAHGLDPFIFTYALSRESYVTAEILTTTYDSSTNTSVGPYVVKTLLDNEVQTSASSGNKLYWDGLDDNGRYVTQGSYLFRVTARDVLFPTKVVTSTVEFPVDLFRVVDVQTTSLLEEATSQATVSYVLSKSMDVRLNIYDRNVVIPNDIKEENWPPHACSSAELAANPDKPQCMYILNPDGSASADENMQPIKTFTGARQGESRVTEYWDGYYELTEAGATGETQAMYPDGFYPYYIYAKANVAGSKYYSTQTVAGAEVTVPQDPKTNENSGFLSKINATDRPVGYITIARGPVYFTMINVAPSSPKLKYSSETIRIPVYEVSFAVTRTASVQVQIVSLADGACSNGVTDGKGTICRVLTKTNTNYLSTIYDGNVTNKLYWDGKDEMGNYVKTDAYQIRFVAVPYPKAGDVTTTIESRILEVDNFQIFDRYTVDVTRDNGSTGMFAYQVSVPMKIAIQIFKPGTMTSGQSDGTLIDPADPTGAAIGENDIEKVLVKAIVGVSPNLIPIERVWDGTDSRGQMVPDGIYPFRYVSVLDSYDMDSITGAIKITSSQSEVTTKVADWDKYANLENIMVVNGDSWYADIDWKSDKVTMFYPNPLRQSYGQFEITKAPAPGTVSIKIFNIAGDLVRDGGYECMNARGVTSTLEQINNSGGIEPDWTTNTGGVGIIDGSGNFALRCKWDRTNNHGKKVARGLYYAIMELTPTKGNAPKSQKVVKILIP